MGGTVVLVLLVLVIAAVVGIAMMLGKGATKSADAAQEGDPALRRDDDDHKGFFG